MPSENEPFEPNGAASTTDGSNDASPDSEDRIQDFLARHGGVGTAPRRRETLDSGGRGWSEIYAADGYVLRCDWSRNGTRNELQFTERPPASAAPATDTR